MKNDEQHIKDEKNSDLQNLSDEELWISASIADDTHVYNVDKAFERFEKRTGINHQPGKTVHLFRNWSVAAVAVFLLGFVTLTAYWQGGKSVRNSFSDIVVEAPLGSKTKLQLPDGSVVWLNAGSRIVYSQGFGVNDRNLEFTGEGYFEVQKNKEIPFQVQTADVNVTVLGTKFNFRNYKDDAEAVVDLLQGKVSLLSHLKPQNLKYLSPSEKMVLDKKTGEIKIKTSKKVKESVEWTNNLLIFDEDLLPDIVKTLERSYNVQIKIENEDLNNIRFYGSFNQREQNIYDVLNMFSETGNLQYIEKNRIIYLQ